MSSRFEYDFLRGYEQNEKFFNGWLKRAYSCFGDVMQCGFIEIHRDGSTFIAANRPEIGEDCLANKVWEHQGDLWGFKDGHVGEVYDANFSGHFRDIGAYLSKFDQFWVMCRVAENENVQRQLFFSSKDPKIYSALINNILFVKKLLHVFNRDCDQISNKCQEHMFDMSSVKKDFLVKSELARVPSVEKLNKLFHDVELLRPHEEITQREWDCIRLYCQEGYSASKTGEELKISRRTVEGHFEAIKNKLKIESKSDIIKLMK